jgi:NADH-quinone oxidoreductase subunit C
MSKAILEALSQRFPDRIKQTYTSRGDDVAVIDPAATLEIHNFLKYDTACDMKLLLSVTAVDYLGQTPRFEVVTNLTSLTFHHRVRLRMRVPEQAPELPSLANLYRTANWWERMVFDLYGIRFTGHPDMRRLYLPQEWVGHPLRKDYPVKARQPIVAERGVRDLIRGPGPNPRTAPLPIVKD